jgi:hemoglobin/transferrin/lactoferrin receptor protein
LLLVITRQISFSQQCHVFDDNSGFPVSNVLITNESKSYKVLTDVNGSADISSFDEMDILSFTHINYVETEILKRHILQSDQKIYLQFKTEFLSEIFLSATKRPEKKGRIAEQIAVFSQSDTQDFSPQSAADMLAEIPGIKVQKSQFGGGSPILRGMEANRVLLVVDGVRMNNAIYRKGHLQNSITVSPNILERTEIIFGPSSVIYGSDALGGVIHYYTRKPLINEKNDVHVEFMSRFSSVNNEKTLYTGIELQSQTIASFTAISSSDFGDLRMGKNRSHGFDDWGKQYLFSNNTDNFYNPDPLVNSDPETQRNIGYKQLDLLQKLNIPLSSSVDLLFNLQYSNSTDIPRYDRLTEYGNETLKYAEWYYHPQKRFLFSTQLSLNPGTPVMENGIITLAYQDIDESFTERKFSSLDRSSEFTNVKVYSLNADFNTSVRDNRIFSYGLEFNYNDVESESLGETLLVDGSEVLGVAAYYPVPTRYPDGGNDYLSTSLYGNYRQDLSNKAVLNTGIRLTNTNMNLKWVDTTFFKLPYDEAQLRNNAITLTVGYVLKPNEEWQINSVFSSGFRSPNIDDVGKVRDKRGVVSVPNINLKPEYAYNLEFGINKYFDDQNYLLSAVAYYTLLEDYIYRAPFEINGDDTIIYNGEEMTMTANVNMDKAYVIGSTIMARGNFTNTLNGFASLTFTRGKAFDTDVPLSSIPPTFGNIGFGYNKNKLAAGLNFKFNAKKSLEDYNLEEGIDNIEETPFDEETQNYYGTPSWTSLDFFARYQILKQVNLQFGLDNIFDQHYKEFASSISAPGRNYTFSVTANF